MPQFGRFFLPLAALAALTSCATLLEGSSQAVQFEAVGAEDVQCRLEAGNELAYNVRPPQTVWLKRSRIDMLADCYAPGNRHKVFKIPTSLEPMAATNVSNGVVPGVTYDAYSRALFRYPDKIIIDMSDTVASLAAAPVYRNIDNDEIEYTGPKTPALPGDTTRETIRKEAFEQYDRDQAFEAEREERKAQYDPGVKK